MKHLPNLAAIIKRHGNLFASVRPLFFEDEYKRAVRPLASCVLVTMNGARFIFTAGHVMRKDSFRNEFERAPVALVTPADQLVSFEKWEAVFTGNAGENQGLDIGFVRLNDRAVDALRACHFLSEDETESNHQDDQSGESSYLLIGYPGSRQLTKIWRGQIRQSSFCVFTCPISRERYQELNIPANNHILLEWDERNVSHNGVRRNMPKVSGISGGGVFHIHKATGKARLVGIITEYHKESSLIVATRIDHFLMLAGAYNASPILQTLIRMRPEDGSHI